MKDNGIISIILLVIILIVSIINPYIGGALTVIIALLYMVFIKN